VALVAVALLAGCGNGIDDRPAKWSFISAAIIEPSCATESCHSAATDRAGVDLSNRNTGYNSLVSRHFVVQCGTPPCDPKQSELVYLLRAQGAARMPPDFPLPEVDVQLIEAWIAAGAPND
jgi:hypothetical protein